ncbi:hypothetical protein D5S17_29005 [Pseudonocardiaceae bacterium YIM PH 21723]|nr:hypothetical protein D5S17_29005 [Pseudonocardiaceae bacterium YIM PH 21723]
MSCRRRFFRLVFAARQVVVSIFGGGSIIGAELDFGSLSGPGPVGDTVAVAFSQDSLKAFAEFFVLLGLQLTSQGEDDR